MIESGSLNDKYQRYIRWWLWSGAGLVTLMLIVGGITRLTGSGLSMTDWNLIMGALPPTSQEAWQQAFAQYKQFPEYQQLNVGMTLGDFKSIFFWEYSHRLLGRFIGLVFLAPFLWFWIRGYFSKRMLRRAWILFALGAAQGAMGWIMVKSGLVDVPRVSHYRLAAHLLFAFALVGCCVWFALDLRKTSTSTSYAGTNNFKSSILGIGILLGIQVLWGALVAGLDAGFIYNTFPLMNGAWMPNNAWTLQPALLNLIQNPGTVQWMHRLIGTILLGVAIWGWVRIRKTKDNTLRIRMHGLLGLLLMQYLFGVLTVVMHVPIALGVLHQAMAMVIWISWLMVWHRYRRFVPR